MILREQAQRAKKAAYVLQTYTEDDKNKILCAIADGILVHSAEISAANKIDLDNFENKESELYDRLTLTPKRLDAMVEGVHIVSELPDPVGKLTGEWTRPNGLLIKKVRAPLGVIAIIYEARPNVTVDAAALCIKSGNAVILRGSKAAINSNRKLYEIMREAVENSGYDPEIVQFIDDESRDAVKEMLAYDDCIDVVIPRGGEGLKHFILENSRIPVLASAGGNCHVYVEKTADTEMALAVIENAKCQRPSVCNAAEHVLVDSAIAVDFIPELYARLTAKGVEILGDEDATEIVPEIKRATDADYDTEFLALRLTVKVVSGVAEAVEIINNRGTHHSEAIISNNAAAQNYFVKNVDAAATYINASTRFTDGFEFGFGAEMGISTGKMHARGPIGLEQLTCERYIITGEGNVRK